MCDESVMANKSSAHTLKLTRGRALLTTALRASLDGVSDPGGISVVKKLVVKRYLKVFALWVFLLAVHQAAVKHALGHLWHRE